MRHLTRDRKTKYQNIYSKYKDKQWMQKKVLTKIRQKKHNASLDRNKNLQILVNNEIQEQNFCDTSLVKSNDI